MSDDRSDIVLRVAQYICVDIPDWLDTHPAVDAIEVAISDACYVISAAENAIRLMEEALNAQSR